MISPILPQGPYAGPAANDVQPGSGTQTQTIAAPPPPEPTNTDNRPGGNDAGRENGLQRSDRADRMADERGPRDAASDASPARAAVEGQMLSRDQEVVLSRAAADAVKDAADQRNEDARNAAKAEAAFAQTREIERQQQEKAATLMRERM